MSTVQTLVDNLWNDEITPETYSSRDKYYDHLFQQYIIYVDTANKISDRRILANSFFLTLHTLLIGIAGFAFKEGTRVVRWWFIVPPLAAVWTLCFVWWRLLKSYRQLNDVKYRVIGEYERKLPSSPHWNAEWKTLGEGKDRKRYTPLANIENYVPITFGLIYVLVAAAIVLAVQ